MKTISGIFNKEVKRAFIEQVTNPFIISKEYLESLPSPLRKYIEYTGWNNREAVSSFNLTFEGDFKMDIGKRWMKIRSDQFNFANPAARFFRIRGSIFSGRDKYDSGRGEMLVKLASLFKVVDARGPEMDRSALVTFFNDACLMAPGMLPLLNVKWEEIDTLHVRGTIRDSAMEISGVLEFNETGELVDFYTTDRYMSADGKEYANYPWSTPVSDYREVNGLKMPAYGEGIHHLPGGKFTYARFRVKNIEFNKTKF